MPSTPSLSRVTHSETARGALRTALRPVPTSVLRDASHRGGTLGALARQGLRHRLVEVAHGPLAGMRVDVGGSNPAYVVGTNERPVQEALEQLLEPGSTCYDVGANIGYFTLLASRLVGPAGRVVAFEPAPENLAVLAGNVERNGADNVLLSSRAVSRSTGADRLQLASFSGGHSLVEAAGGNTGVAPLVETVALDDFVDTAGVPRPDLVKIDVEGAELLVLEGMTRLLGEGGPIVLVEADGADEAEHDRRLAPISELLTDRGYRLERLEDSYPTIEWVVSHWVARPPSGG
ncbi:MAG: FkbM family methyltransferase [Actinomycetota bacterium]